MYPTFMPVITAKLQGVSGNTQSFNYLFLTNMWLLECDPQKEEAVG